MNTSKFGPASSKAQSAEVQGSFILPYFYVGCADACRALPRAWYVASDIFDHTRELSSTHLFSDAMSASKPVGHGRPSSFLTMLKLRSASGRDHTARGVGASGLTPAVGTCSTF
jgi:hypothetical protein